MQRYFLLIIVLSSYLCLRSQSEYAIEYETETVLVAASSLMLGASFLIDHNVSSYNLLDINNLNIEDVNPFDRVSTGYYSKTADILSDVFLSINSLAPLTLFLTERGIASKNELALMYGEVVLVNGAITLMTKSLSQRGRPYVYNTLVPIAEKVKLDAKKSFFSGHVSQSTALAFFGARVFSDLYPESKYKTLIWASAATLPLVTAYGRFKAGKHFPSDLFSGYLVGAGVGLLIPYLHRNNRQSNSKVQLFSRGQDAGISININ